MLFAVTIDTEEDNWGEYTRPSYTVENIGRIARLQDLFNRRGIRPTYLISYPVATDPAAIDLLGGYLDKGLCEIGTHPHPWNTPPVEEALTPPNSFICNLPAELQYRKIRTLTETIESRFGVRPTSFRAGRWGFDEGVARNLIRLGYTVDTSVHPIWNGTREAGPDFSRHTCTPFVFRSRGDTNGAGSLLEAPASVAFLQSPTALATSVFRSIDSLPQRDRVVGVLSKLRLLNRVCVSPELNLAADMIEISRRLLSRGARLINMFFHSPSLLPKCSPFVRSEQDAERFLVRIDKVLEFAQAEHLRSVTMSELAPVAVGATTHTWLDTDAVLAGVKS